MADTDLPKKNLDNTQKVLSLLATCLALDDRATQSRASTNDGSDSVNSYTE